MVGRSRPIATASRESGSAKKVAQRNQASASVSPIGGAGGALGRADIRRDDGARELAGASNQALSMCSSPTGSSGARNGSTPDKRDDVGSNGWVMAAPLSARDVRCARKIPVSTPPKSPPFRRTGWLRPLACWAGDRGGSSGRAPASNDSPFLRCRRAPPRSEMRELGPRRGGGRGRQRVGRGRNRGRRRVVRRRRVLRGRRIRAGRQLEGRHGGAQEDERAQGRATKQDEHLTGHGKRLRRPGALHLPYRCWEPKIFMIIARWTVAGPRQHATAGWDPRVQTAPSADIPRGRAPRGQGPERPPTPLGRRPQCVPGKLTGVSTFRRAVSARPSSPLSSAPVQ